MLDPIEFSKSMSGIVKDVVAPLIERIEKLEAREPLRGEPGKNGDPGKDAEPISNEQISRSVSQYLRANPPAQGLKGDPGDDGKPGEDAEPISEEQIARAVERYVRLNPPTPGAKGDPGEPGKKGDQGADAEPIVLQDVVDELLESDKLLSLVEMRAREAVAAIPPPKDGSPGKDGAKGDKGDPGTAGDKGDQGADGIGLAGAMIDRDGTLIITTTKGDAVRLGLVVGKDGNDGNDGLGFDDMDASYNGERGVTLKFARGEKAKEYNFHLPVIMDRGYWREGFKAKQGDAVTYDGTLWIALRDTTAKPCLEKSEDWRIGARKGRDGRNGKNGLDAPGVVKLESASA